MQSDGISWRADFGCWWPDYDQYPDKCFFLVNRNLTDMDVAATLCLRRHTCVQAGGHAGLWPKRLAGIFHQVFTFEPDPPLFACAEKNLAGIKNIVLKKQALGEKAGTAMFQQYFSAGSGRIDPAGDIETEVVTIDSLNLQACDAIFLDIEGHEVGALQGAAATIKRFRPVLMVEELPRAREEIQAHLRALGYRMLKKVHKDCVYVSD